MTVKKIPMGSEVQCAISGVKGIVQTETEMINGNLRYGVQPKSTDGAAMPDAWDIDMQTLDVIGPGVSDRAVPPPENIAISVGDTVRDLASKFVGVTVSKTVHMNGCIYFNVVPKIKDSTLLNDAPAGSYLPIERLEKVGDGILKKIAEVRSEAPPTGGPSTRSQRA